MPQKKKKKSSTGTNSSSSNSSLTTSEQHDLQEESDSPQLSQSSKKEEQQPQKKEDLTAILEDLDQILVGPSVNRGDCVAGIKKADEAISDCSRDEEYEDLRCSLQLKRAKLLKILIDKRYGVVGLASQHQKPLESCMCDCQQVLSALRAREEGSPMTAVYQEAKSLLIQTKKLKREEDPDVRTRSGTTVAQSHHSTSGPLFFEPSKTHIKDVVEIHPVLLQDVVNCYKKYKYVCRVCFIRYNRQEIVVGGKPCKRCKNAATVRIMPASKLCKNFRDLKILAIPPPPKVLMAPTNRHKPFLYCRNSDHLLCYDRAKESWYAHSVEELVVWNIERYYDCSFTEYVNKHHVEVVVPPPAADDDSPDNKNMQDNLDSFSDEQEEYEFYPNESSFLPRSLVNIPKHLLDDVIKCYSERREYCKTCFYKMGKKGELTVSPQNTSVCKLCRRPWQRVVVMPSSRLCWNFGDFDVIPVAPLPRAKTMSQYSTFKYCINDDHYRCFRVYIDNEFWYAHSVEELVIWTVEREKDCTFSQFINKGRKPAPSPPGLSLPTSPPPHPHNHTPTAKSPTATTTETTTTSSTTATMSSPSSTAQSTTIPFSSTATTDSDPPETKGQSSGKIGSSTPSFSQVVVSGPPVKMRPPPPGKAKTVEKEKELQPVQISVDVDSVSFNSSSSGVDQGTSSSAGSSARSTAAVSAFSPPATAAVAARATSPGGGVNPDGSGQLGGAGCGHSTTKTRHLSESSYMTANSQDSVSSHGNEDLSQDSVHSVPIKPKSHETSSDRPATVAAVVSKPKTAVKSNSIRGRPNYSVVQSTKASEGVGGGEGEGKTRKERESCDGVVSESNATTVSIEREEQLEVNLTSSEMSNTEFESSTACPSDTGLSQPSSDLIFSPPHTPLAHSNFSSNSAATNETSSFQTVSSSLPNGGFSTTTSSTNKTGFTSGSAGLTSGYRPSRPPGYSHSPAGFSSHLDSLVSPNHKGFTPAFGGTAGNSTEVYKFQQVNFRVLADIPVQLIVAIATSYGRHREVCRKCFFGERNLCREGGGVCAECGQPWENPVTVIPGCKECNNEPCFDSDDCVPLHPLPPVATIRRCALKNHHKCFQKCLESNPKFAHSIQQLVVWLIESEKDCLFEEFIQGDLQLLVSHPRPDSTSHHPPGMTGLHSRQFSGPDHVTQLHRSTQPGFVASPGSGINASPSPTDLKPPPTANTTATNSNLRPLTPKYNKNVGYEYIEDIPSDLLAGVALAYHSQRIACRQCFFTGSRVVTTTKRKSSDTCIEGHPWRPLTIIPGCRLCYHPRGSTANHIPVLPVPRHMKDRRPAQFCVCKKSDHTHCYKQNTTPWFPHSVEELVIWTVEREKGTSFENVYKSYLPDPDSHLTPETVLFLPPSSSSSSSSFSSSSLAHTSASKPGGMPGKTRSPAHPPSSSSSSSSAPVSRNGGDTTSSRATVAAHSDGVPLATTRDGAGSTTKPSSATSSLTRHQTFPSATTSRSGDKSGHTSDVSASLTSGGGESSDTGSVPGSSESVQSSLTEITSENPFPEALQPLQQQQPPAGVVGVAPEQNGLPSGPVSLFHDPLIYYGSSTSAVMQSSESGGPPYDGSDSDDCTLDLFPALRQGANTDAGKQHSSNLLSPPPLGNDVVVNTTTTDLDLASARDIVENHRNLAAPPCDTQPQKKQEEKAAVPETNGKLPDAQTRQTLEDEELLHAEHNRYRSSKSSARPENWPDVQEPSPTTTTTNNKSSSKDSSSSVDGHESDNPQGQRESPPYSSLESSSGFGMDGAEETQERESASRGNDVTTTNKRDATGIKSKSSTAAVAEASGAQSPTKKSQVEQEQKTEPAEQKEPSTTSSDPNESKVTITATNATTRNTSRPGSQPQTPSEAGTPPALTRRESLDVNAKEFTPRSVILRSDSKPAAANYPSGLNPNAAAVYPYITNGGMPCLTTLPLPLVNPLPTVTAVMSGGPQSATRRKMKGPAQPMTDPSSSSSTNSSSSSNTIPYPTSEISSSPTSPLSPPHSPTQPHKCFLCYLAFPDPPSLRRHCKTAAHISTLLRDCGAPTIWKNLPPPPGQPRELMKLCVNYSCTRSRLTCIQPHFADEFAEQLRRVEHHNKREALRKPLPPFSDQHDGLLISPLERVTQYTTLKVSVKEPLQAILTDASASFTWTISVQGQHWQTLFGIHLKSESQNPVFQITDLEDANAQVEGKCQSDRANWVASTPADAILLGRLSFSVRASPEGVNGNFNCRVCLNLGFYQHAYISLALVVNDPKLTRKPAAPSLPPPPLSEFPPIADPRPRVQSAPHHKRSPDATTTRPQSASSLPDEKEAAAALAESEQLVVQSTNHHVQPSSSSSSDRPVSNGVGNVWRRGGTEGGREGGGKRKGEKDGGKTNGQGPETSQQDSREPDQTNSSHSDHMTSNDVITSPTSTYSSSHV